MHLPPLDFQSSLPLVTMSRHSFHPAVSSLSPAAVLYATSSRPQSPAPDVPGIQKLLRDHFRSSRTCLQQIERIQAGLHRLYLLHLTDGSRLVLKCPPAASTRLLRSEHLSLVTEAHILELLANSSPRGHLPIPSLLCADTSPDAEPLGCSYVLRTHVHGISLAHIRPHLNRTDLAQIDHALGSCLKSLASLRAPAFGPALAVAAGRGSGSWREAFLLLLEAVLRDAEDMLIALPYDFIRSLVQAQQATLDGVRTPVLVAMDAGRAGNVQVDEVRRCVSGLVGWGNSVWGDALLAGVCWGYSADQTDESNRMFWQGFGGCGGSEAEVVRMKIYAVYKAVVAVVTQYYRPAQLDHEELEARRALTRALNDLRETV
ncbi:aminoglycoside phosphotransferase protein [Diplodia corticola]|uniref:Aminoglycoside phosphotransferase protein n=1 Tax=Diplodia corticola TaxID=236234 RepID=A0A1J9R1Y4_9PEZI|nr:aminoglycoside phosphotransferase protein [Diplodia corticola]OJD34648.1 aminoglycoside phosphotransferase protein [Diplodia corticola]